MGEEAQSEDFLRLFDVREIDDHVFETHPSHLDRLYGGQLLAQAIGLAHRTGPEEWRARSIHAQFLAVGDPDTPLRFTVRRARDGSALATRLVDVDQDDRMLFAAQVSLVAARDGADYQQPAPADMPAPVPGPHWIESDWAGFNRRMQIEVLEDMAHALAPPHDGGRYGATRRLWARLPGRLGDEPIVHQCGIAYLSDMRHGMAMRPVIDSEFTGMTSLDHALWFHRPARADEWVLIASGPVAAAHGLGLAASTMHDSHGHHLATSAQQVMYRPA